MKKAVFAVLTVYVFLSLLASVLVSTLPAHAADWIIEHRAPLLIIELTSVTPHSVDSVYDAYGPDRHGRNIYCYSPADIGRTVTTVFVWSPCNNAYDGTIARFDF